MEVVGNRKKLDLDAIAKRNIPFYLHVFDTEKMTSSFIDFNFQNNPMQTLRFAANAVPYFYPNNLRYVDGEIANYFPIEMVMKDNPDKEIIVILNIIRRKFFRRLVKSFLEGFVASLMYGPRIWRFYMARDLEKEYKKHKADKNIKIIAPGKELNLWPDTVDRKVLLRAFEAGKEAGRELLKEFA
jgi:predicted patatin/cPLA2 family phospholipase